jgi:hypothetical protein
MLLFVTTLFFFFGKDLMLVRERLRAFRNTCTTYAYAYAYTSLRLHKIDTPGMSSFRHFSAEFSFAQSSNAS